MAVKTEPFRSEHEQLREHICHLRFAAREMPRLAPDEREIVLGRVLEFLHEQLLPHACAEEASLYVEVGKILGNQWATGPMRYDHRQIRRLVEELEHLDPNDLEALQEALYGLHALVGAHFEKEEELYLPLLEGESDAEVQGVYDRLISAEHASGRPFLRR